MAICVWLKATVAIAPKPLRRNSGKMATNTCRYLKIQTDPLPEIGKFDIAYDKNMRPAIQHTVTNFGLGHAFLKERCVKSVFEKRLPEPLEYSCKDKTRMDIPLKGADEFNFRTDIPNDMTLSEMDSRETDKFLFIYGYYLCDDVFDMQHTVWFAFQATHRAFAPTGGVAYNRRESKKKDEAA
jgi:hypothetical protein